jgi:hypothetical protein
LPAIQNDWAARADWCVADASEFLEEILEKEGIQK